MKYAFALSLVVAFCAGGLVPLQAEPKKKQGKEEGIEAPVVPSPIELPKGEPAGKGRLDANAARVTEFQGDEISVVLRALARQAGVNVVLSERVKGTVTLRVENKTPRELIEIVAKANALRVDELHSVLYIKLRSEAWTPEREAYETQLEYQARPEVARQRAVATKALFDALLGQGFTREEALRIVLAEGERPMLFSPGKKEETAGKK